MVKLTHELASKVERLIAHVLESIIISLVTMVLAFLFSVPITEVGNSYALIFLGFLATAIVNVYFWTKSTSMGKAVLGIKVVDKATGENLSVTKMMFRDVVGKYVSGAVFSLGYIWIIFEKNKQGWHDKMVSSVVIKTFEK